MFVPHPSSSTPPTGGKILLSNQWSDIGISKLYHFYLGMPVEQEVPFHKVPFDVIAGQNEVSLSCLFRKLWQTDLTD